MHWMPQELELQIAMKHLSWVLGTNFVPSARAVYALDLLIISSLFLNA